MSGGCEHCGQSTCEQCGVSFTARTEEHRFCGDVCRRHWHREHDPECTIRTVTKLVSGKVSVCVHFEGKDADRAITFATKSRAVLGVMTDVPEGISGERDD